MATVASELSIERDSQDAFRRRFFHVSNGRGVVDLVWAWGGVALAATMAHQVGAWWAYALALLAIAGFQHAMIILQHEAWHFLCFRSRRLNDFMGAWAYAYPVGMPYYHERRRHMSHHRMVGREEDPDWRVYSNDGRAPASQLALFLLGRLAGSLLFGIAGNLLFRGKARVGAGDEPRRPDEPSLIAEYARAASCQVALLAAFAAGGRWWEYFVLWALPLATVTSLLVSLRGFLEHAHPDDHAPTAERLYDFKPTVMERFFISPCHFHFHALHHAYPRIPHGKLASARRFLDERGGGYEGEWKGTYSRFLLAHVARLRSRRTKGAGSDPT